MTLTEQWKKGELEVGEYYLRYKDGSIDREYYDYANLYEFVTLKGFSSEDCEISEVLAPVPSYEEWQELKDEVEIYHNNFKLMKAELERELENQQLKELLNQCKYELRGCYTDIGWEDWSLITKINNAIGEK